MSVKSRKARARLRGQKLAPRWERLAKGRQPPAPIANAWEGKFSSAGPVVFPILQRYQVGDCYSIDPDGQGSAFFVTMGEEGGLFLTAKHVVESHSQEKPFGLLIIDPSGDKPSFYASAVQRLALHPHFDAALGLVHLSSPVPSALWNVGRRRLQPGEPFVTFGFPSTELETFRHSDGTGLATNFHPAEVKGFIERFQDDEDRFGPVYIHTTTLAGGISGGPLMSALDCKVYALNSRGFPPDCEMALSIVDLLDWEIPFLRKSLGMILDEAEAAARHGASAIAIALERGGKL